MTSQILSFGYLPAVVLCGYWLVSNPLKVATAELGTVFKLGLGVSLGILVWFPILFVTANLNVFSPSVIGLAGWAISFAVGFLLIISPPSSYNSKASKIDYLIAGLSIVMVAFNGIYTSESILGGRDQGLYATHGAHIAQTGRLRSEPPYEKLYEGENLELVSSSNPGGYFFDFHNGDMYMQFPPTVALHLGQFFGIGSYEGLLWFNPLIAGINILLFFGLSIQFMSRRWAFVGTCLFALNAAQVWNARITLSEILTQNFILAGLALAAASLARENRLGYIVACLIASAAAFTRVDGFLIPAFLIISNLLLQLTHTKSSKNGFDKALRSSSLGILALFACAYIYNAQTTAGYFVVFSGKIKIVFSIGVLLTLIQYLPEKTGIQNRIRSTLLSRFFLNRVIVALVLLAIYAYFIRPYMEPFSEFENKHYGIRNYRENSLIDLSKYLSIPVIVLALWGLGVAIRNLSDRQKSAIAIPLVSWLGFSLIYLYDPQISTDHIWRIRRFTPLVIPGFIFFAIWGAASIDRVFKLPDIRKFVFYGFAMWAAFFLYTSLRPIAFLKQYEGTIELVRKVSQSIPKGALTLANVSSEILGPLQLAEGHKMIRDRLDGATFSPVALNIIEDEFSRGRDLYFLSQHPIPESSSITSVEHWKHSVPKLVKTHLAPATEVQIQNRDLYLSRLTSSLKRIALDQSHFDFGATPVFNVTENGMHGIEYDGAVPFRWTQGEASFTLNHELSRNPKSLVFDIFSNKPEGGRIGIIVNDVPVFSKILTNEPATITVSLENVPFDRNLNNIKIVAEKWVPSQILDNVADHRELGVAIKGLTLMFDDEIRIGTDPFGNVPKRGISESGFYPVEVIDGQSVRWTQGKATFSLLLRNGFVPKSLFLDFVGGNRLNQSLTIRLNGKELSTLLTKPSFSSLKIPIGELSHEDRKVTIEISCDPFIPAEIGPSNDTRELGIQIHGLRFNR